MNRFVSGTAAFSFIVGATLAAAGSAQALSSCTSYPCVLSDTFNGGVTTYGSMTGDTIENPGSHNFEIQGAIITRPTASSLDIKVYTKFAGLSNTAAASPGITYGSVFFGSSASADGPAFPNNNPGYTPGQWTKAYVIGPYTPNTPAGVVQTTTGPGQLYDIGPLATPHTYAGANNTGLVKDYYTTGDGSTNFGKIYMSNVNGNPITYPHPGRVPFYFREGQAVRYIPNNTALHQIGTGGTLAGGNGWQIGNDAISPALPEVAHAFIEFAFNDAGALGDTFVLAWTMTCGNDVFQGFVNIPPPVNNNIPVPGAFVLMGTVLFGAGGLAKWRKSRERKAAA